MVGAIVGLIPLEQKDIVEEYMARNEGKPYSEMARELRIERSRLYRILNGHEMKLSEYLKMKEAVNEN